MMNVNEIRQQLKNMDNKRVKRLALEIINGHGGVQVRLSDFTVADARQVLVEEIMLRGYQL